MKLTIQQHLGNPNMCRIPELTIRSMAECEGGGWWMPREQAEQIVSDCAFSQKCIDDGWRRAMTAPMFGQQLAENDLYYLRSIKRNLDELSDLAEETLQPSIGGEVLADNLDWLNCFIDRFTP